MLDDLLIERNARAGVAVFAGRLRVSNSQFRCNPFDLDLDGVLGELNDAGQNVCGCDTEGACKTATANLEPVPFPDP